MPPVLEMPQPRDRKPKGLDNHRIFRPEAVEAYTMRRAGEAWEAKARLEGWFIAALTITAAAASVFLFFGGR